MGGCGSASRVASHFAHRCNRMPVPMQIFACRPTSCLKTRPFGQNTRPNYFALPAQYLTAIASNRINRRCKPLTSLHYPIAPSIRLPDRSESVWKSRQRAEHRGNAVPQRALGPNPKACRECWIAFPVSHRIGFHARRLNYRNHPSALID